MRNRLFVLLLVSCAMGLLAQAPAPQNPPAASGTEISADLGPCSAAFKVTDLAGKPIYNAKIAVQIRYGFMAKKKLDLEVATDATGRAKFLKLPAEARRPITFKLSSGAETAEVGYDPATTCDANYVVPLGNAQKK